VDVETIEAIMTRRSIRKFTAQPLAPELVETLLKAAMQAPSAGNQQPWHFVVLDDRDVLDRVPTANPNAAMAAHAPLAILVCGDTRLEMHPGYWIEDCSAALENLLLAAHALGLGAVWTGITPRVERVTAFKEMFGLPAEVEPLGLVVLGYPAQAVPPASRFKPERVHRNAW
jgi:nitroreductase